MNTNDTEFPAIEFRVWTGKKMIYQGKNIEQDKELPCKQYLGSFIRRVVLQIMLDNDAGAPLDHESYLPNGGNIDEYLQQFTGLRDKNGKKVYFGDIIDCNYMWWGLPIHERHVVRYSEFMQILPFHQAFSYGSDRRLWINELADKFEIIGNCKENPDLLPGEAPTHE